MVPVVFSDPVSWHAHGMIYGFALAIVAGFLLTAVPNWTGGEPVRQIKLLALVLIWVLGRVLMNVELGLPRVVVIMGATVFTPALALMLAIPLIKSWNKRNFIFLGILGVLFFSDLAFLLTEEREFLLCGVVDDWRDDLSHGGADYSILYNIRSEASGAQGFSKRPTDSRHSSQ